MCLHKEAIRRKELFEDGFSVSDVFCPDDVYFPPHSFSTNRKPAISYDQPQLPRRAIPSEP